MNRPSLTAAIAILALVLFMAGLPASSPAQNADQQQNIETIMQRLAQTDENDLQAFEDGYLEAIKCCPDTNLVHEAYMRLDNLWLYGFEPPKQDRRIVLAEQYLQTYGEDAPQSAGMLNTLTATYDEAGQHEKLAKLYDPYFADPAKPWPLDQFEAHRFAYAEALEKSGRTAEALAQYKTVVEKGEIMEFILGIARERVTALEGAAAAQPASQPAPQPNAQAATLPPVPEGDEPLPPDPAVPGEPEYDQGLTAFTNKDYAGALQYFDTAARAGNANAQYSLGMMHYKGLGTPKDEAKAAEWFAKAEAGGHPKAGPMLEKTGGAPAPAPDTATSPAPEPAAAPAVHKAQAVLAANGVDLAFPAEWLNPAEPTDPLNVASSPQGFEDLPIEDSFESRDLDGKTVLFAPGAAQPFTGAACKLDGNGKLSSITQFKDGLRHGRRYVFNYKFGTQDKYLESVEEYVDGKLHGPLSKYRKDGRLYSRLYYEKGAMHGPHYGWHPDGGLSLWENHDRNTPQGVYLELYENGNPQSYLVYERGRSNGTTLHFYEDGTLQAKQMFENGICAGPRQTFNPDGSVKAVEPCKQ